MSSAKSTDHSRGTLADRVYWWQLHVFQVCSWIFCALPCLALVIFLAPQIGAFMAAGPQRSSMLVLKLLMLIPLLLVFVGLLYLAFLLAAVFNVPVVRLMVRDVRLPDARGLLLQFYTDPRWQYQNRDARHFRWWASLWGGMAKNRRLMQWCEHLTAGMIALLYG